jgi:hypothetical protein
MRRWRATPVTFDTALDFVESWPFRIGAVVLLVAGVAWIQVHDDSVDRQATDVCVSLYRTARTAAESTGIDTSRTLVRKPHNTAVVSEPCVRLRLTGRLD